MYYENGRWVGPRVIWADEYETWWDEWLLPLNHDMPKYIRADTVYGLYSALEALVEDDYAGGRSGHYERTSAARVALSKAEQLLLKEIRNKRVQGDN